MNETGDKVFKPNEAFVKKAHIKSMDEYKKMYKESIEHPDKFWGKMAEDFKWFKKWNTVREFDFVEGKIKFFDGGKTNVTYNCLDRHLEKKGDKVAYLWEGNEPGEDKKITYRQLHEEVCKFANVLKKHGVKKGDRVCLYMQMIPELAIGMLACARIGAVHSVVFGAFSPDSLKDRIQDSSCKILVTQDTALRGKKNDIPMKTNADKALESCPSIEKTIVVKRTGLDVPMKGGRDVW
ncbi:MAG: AMP-binding protein, partial [Candidatus Gracilibacteria bacterium]|nr:AMP-binding protein [Candidatus Gracilibacteria bacterium]